MKTTVSHYLAAFIVVSSPSLWAAEPESSVLVRVAEHGLVYETTANGDRIPDFSYCGYRGGGVLIPDVPVQVALKPRKEGDDTARIQNAIDKVAAGIPMTSGFRGAVLLAAGTYRVDGTLQIRESGIVLRGARRDHGGTIIIAAGTQKRPLIQVSGGRPGSEINGTRRAIISRRVPVGARTLRLTTSEGLAVGDAIEVFRPATEAWISRLGTDKLNRGPRDKVRNWTPREYSLGYERGIDSIDGDAITVDAPIVCALEAKHGGGAVYKTSRDGRICQVGIESLRLVSEYRKGSERHDEAHAWDAVKIGSLVDGWAGANMVFWNCRARSIDCQKPPTANNYCIGCTGRIRGNGHIESPGKPVQPRSLYLRQLEERLGVQAVKNVTTEEQRKGAIDDTLRKRFAE